MKALVLFLTCFTIGLNVACQPVLVKQIRKYYRINPFRGSFSTFVNALSTDTALKKSQQLKETDSRGYFLRGVYNVFNPFQINADKIDMLFYKGWEPEAIHMIGAFYTYQITGYFPDSELVREKVKREYRELARKIKKEYVYVEKESLAGRYIEDGETLSFYHKYKFPTATTIVSWQTLPLTKQVALSFIVRLKQERNHLYPFRPASNY